MITETTYGPSDLESGTCISCGEKSDEIYWRWQMRRLH